jgi:hypothetical protein
MLSTYADCIGNNIADLTGFLQAEVQGEQQHLLAAEDRHDERRQKHIP